MIIDSIDQLIYLGEDESSRSREAEVSRTLKLLAAELGVPIIAVDTVPHSPGDLTPYAEPPNLGDLNGIEEDADVVVVVHRDDLYDLESPRAGEVDLIVVKHRDGPTGTVTAAAQLHLARFVDTAVQESMTSPGGPSGRGG